MMDAPDVLFCGMIDSAVAIGVAKAIVGLAFVCAYCCSGRNVFVDNAFDPMIQIFLTASRAGSLLWRASTLRIRRSLRRGGLSKNLTRRANHRHMFIVTRIEPAPENR